MALAGTACVDGLHGGPPVKLHRIQAGRIRLRLGNMVDPQYTLGASILNAVSWRISSGLADAPSLVGSP
jgi:hypothetical protein